VIYLAGMRIFVVFKQELVEIIIIVILNMISLELYKNVIILKILIVKMVLKIAIQAVVKF